jgi:hypothetical protein
MRRPLQFLKHPIQNSHISFNSQQKAFAMSNATSYIRLRILRHKFEASHQMHRCVL